MPEFVYREHKTGEIVTYKAFTSTTTTPISNTNMILYSRTGKKLSSRLSDENEVLFKSHSKFIIRYNSCEEQKLPVWQDCNLILEEVHSN